MNLAIVVFYGTIGFGCVPPPDADLMPPSYSGPWGMPRAEAESIAKSARERGNIVDVIKLEDLGFATVANHCPPIYFSDLNK